MADLIDGTHPRFRWLVDLSDGVLSGQRAGHVQQHLDDGCPPCHTQLREIATLRGALAAGPLPAPPAAMMRRASRLFPRARLRHAMDTVARIAASLVFDQRTAFAPALRAGGGSRQLLWTIGDYELVVTLTAERQGTRLRGQFLPLHEDEAQSLHGAIRFHWGTSSVTSCEIDQNGEFKFDHLRAGTHVGEGEVGAHAFSIPPFVID